jgi:type II secretory pathway component PulK
MEISRRKIPETSHRSRRHDAESGTTLLITIVLCALLSVLAVGLLSRGRTTLQSARNRIAQRQMEWAAGGALRLARAALEADPTRTVDHPSEPWGQTIGPIPIGNTVCTIQAEDLQARLNLNNLALETQPGARSFSEIFNTFLSACEIPSTRQHTQALEDWIDSDSAGWAEDTVYSRRTPPHRSKNAPLNDKGELRWIEGWPMEFWQEIENPRTLQYTGAPADMVTILPRIADSSSWTTINLNTAPLPVLLSVLGANQRGAAEAIIQWREDRPILNVEQIAPLVSAGVLDGARRWIDVRSDYYRVRITVESGRRRQQWAADLNRVSGNRNLGLRLWMERSPDLLQPEIREDDRRQQGSG